jgi:hypothetical protein
VNAPLRVRSDGGLLDVRWCGDRFLGMEAAGADAGVVG